METKISFIFHLHFKIFLESNTASMSLLINEPKHWSQRWFTCRITFQDNHSGVGITFITALTDGIIKRWDIIWPRAVISIVNRDNIYQRIVVKHCFAMLVRGSPKGLQITTFGPWLSVWEPLQYTEISAGLRPRQLSPHLYIRNTFEAKPSSSIVL